MISFSDQKFLVVVAGLTCKVALYFGSLTSKTRWAPLPGTKQMTHIYSIAAKLAENAYSSIVG